MLERIALRIAYDGAEFGGFQRQPGKRTVEGEILSALRRIRAIRDASSAGYRCSSRTDAGVSAIGNVISIYTSFPIEGLQRALNSGLEDVWCTGTAILPPDFDVRHDALSREYWYFMLSENLDIERMRMCAGQFLGKHDYSRYGRADGRDPRRRILSFEVSEKDSLIFLRIKGESFLWNQVRRMAWAVEQVGRGLAEPEEIAPENYGLRRIGLAPPENLILANVDIGFEFKSRGRDRATLRDITNRLVEASVRRELLRAALDDLSNRQIA